MARRFCTIDGCNKPHFGRGFCNAHYLRWKRHGSPLGGRAPYNESGKFKTCTIEGCKRPHWAFGLCQRHYWRQRRHGNPNIACTSPSEPLQFLRANVSYEGDDCLIWPFATGRGYGVVKFRGRQTTANYVMCILAHGEPPTSAHESAHSCGNGNKGCINPKHLRWDTRAGNHADKIKHDTHTRGERSKRHKLTEKQAREIFVDTTASQRDLAKKYGVHVATISAIKTGKNWRWLNEVAA